MLNYAPYESDELAESDEFLEYDESDESDEARRRSRAPVRTARRGGTVPARPMPGFATRAELTATANRLDAKIVVNSSAIRAVEARTNKIASDNGKLRAEVNKLQGGLNDVRNMAMLMPLLSSQSTKAVTASVAGLAAGDKVVIDTGDSFSRILPLLMFSGTFGGSSQGGTSGGSSSGSMFGGGDNGMMMVAMMIALQGKN